MKMKALFLIILVFIACNSYGQTRIKNLTEQPTYDGDAYVPVDKSGYAAVKKMKISVLMSNENSARATADTITRRGAGLADSGNFLPDASSHYIQASDFSGYDTASIMTGMHILDSVLYNTAGMWERGDSSTAVKQAGTGSEAINHYSLAFNYYNVAEGQGSAVGGFRGVSKYPYSFAWGGGTHMTDLGANSMTFFVGSASSKAGSADTIEINNLYPLSVPVDLVIGFEIDIVGVEAAGASGSVGDAFYQKWSGCIRNDAGTTALIGTADSTTAKRSATNISIISVTADNTNDQLNIICSGGANRDIEFTAYIRFTVVGYRNFTLGY